MMQENQTQTSWEDVVLNSDFPVQEEAEATTEETTEESSQEESEADEAEVAQEPAEQSEQAGQQQETQAEEPAKPIVATPQEPAKEEVKEEPIVPQFKDEYSRQLYEAIASGNELVVKEYLDSKFRDYNSMPDMDVLRESMKQANPSWTEKEVDLELRMKYAAIPAPIDISSIDEFDTEALAEAQAHNDRVEYLQIIRERDARIARQELEAKKASIELPYIETKQEAPIAPTAEEIQEMNRRWEAAVEAEVPKLPDLTFKVGNEEVTYKASDEEKNEFVSIMKNFNDLDYLTKRGWYDEQGNIQILKVAEDVRILERKDKIFASLATQMKTVGKKETIAKDIKNLDLDGSRTQAAPTVKSFFDTALDA